MGKLRTIKLSSTRRQELENGYTNGTQAVFRKRCHLVLLKSDGRSAKDISSIIGLNKTSIGNWLTRYEAEGISGLKNKPGQGRKAILDPTSEKEKVAEAVKAERQRLSQAKSILEKNLGKRFSKRTLQRFLKKLTADTSESD